MFSGIVETQAPVLSARKEGGLVRIEVARPNEFNDIREGDSIAVNGVCLTVECFTPSTVTFALGAETLQVTGWTERSLAGQSVNVERSLRFGDRVHGHLVTGHVDSLGDVVSAEDAGGSLILRVRVNESLLPFIWKKGSWAVNGVSLTINEVDGTIGASCLIPETLRRTNLGALRPGDRVNIEVDMVARAIHRTLELDRK